MKKHVYQGIASASLLWATACTQLAEPRQKPEAAVSDAKATIAADATLVAAPGSITPEIWPALTPAPKDPAIEARIDEILAVMTLEQKVGQVIQADSASVTPEDVRDYRLGSILSGGNSAPGPMPYADTATWLADADAYFEASLDPTGVEMAIPIIWGIDAVHGHANLTGATVFPHNIGLGAARDPDLIEEIARATAVELSVSGHDWTFAPTLAVPRDDRWGRTYEGFAEHPEIAKLYGDRIVYGLQGRPGQDEFMSEGRVISTAKHFLADGGTQNGVDQGDALISEQDLRDIHTPGYLSALEAGAQSVMISFSSWQGVKMTGNKEIITDLLKERMGFDGFVISDWNAHGQIPGCSNTDCPVALEAGLDMFMAPDSWKGLYESTLAHVKSGRVSEDRLDDAVRRILRAKLRYGLFDKPSPSARPLAGDTDLLGSAAHRDLARRAVRQSLVLLKNEAQTLPIDRGARVLVIGDGADSIAKAAGGWTLTWQGGGHENEMFPNGQSILDGIREAVEGHGGEVIFDATGETDTDADIVIAVYGEDPYAEFQGDRVHLDFEPNGFDTSVLKRFQARSIPVVSVFLSGRPLWVNPELNASDAFVAAWLPGSEGGGVADLLFQTEPDFDFTGRLSFSWPASALQAELNVGAAEYTPAFAYGYGLSYGDEVSVSALSEDSGLTDDMVNNTGTFFAAGQVAKPWSLYAQIDGSDVRIGDIPYAADGVTISRIDRAAQEDSLRVDWRDPAIELRFASSTPRNMERESNGDLELALKVRLLEGEPTRIDIGMGCETNTDCRKFIPITVDSEDWQEKRISISCFAAAGVDVSDIQAGIILQPNNPVSIGLSDIQIASDTDGKETCGGTL